MDNFLRKELCLSKYKAYNLGNFWTFAAILKILHPQCIAITVHTPPGWPHSLPHLPWVPEFFSRVRRGASSAAGQLGRAVGRSVGRSVYGHVIPKFSRMGRLPHFLSYGAPRVELRY